MTTRPGCIADGLAGAPDLAGLRPKSGVRVSLRIGVPDAPPDAAFDAAAPFEVIAPKCRTAPVDQAVDECRAAPRRAGCARRFFWKYGSTFDSTPERDIAPVAEALMADLGASQTTCCPAFPENGRAIFMGRCSWPASRWRKAR